MRSIGFPELLFLFVVPLMLIIPIAIMVLIITLTMRARRRMLITSSRICGHCRQAIPYLGSYCPLCGGHLPPA
jgi:hypothetical protein